MQPSLLVLLVGGWGQAASGPGNLFTSRDDGYFSELLATYPAVFVRQAEAALKLPEIYRRLGTLAMSAKPSLSLAEILSGHGLRLHCVADADRYGLITETMHLGRVTAREQEEWNYIPLPPATSLTEVPASSTPFVVEAALEAMKQDKDSVVFVNLNAIWSVGLCGQLAATREAVAATQQAAKELIHKATERLWRVLVIGDQGLAESYVSADSLRINAAPTQHPLPCVLVHKQLEGLTASGHDRVEAIEAGPVQATASWDDIAPTILALMDIPPRPHTAGRMLFAEHIERLRRPAAGTRAL